MVFDPMQMVIPFGQHAVVAIDPDEIPSQVPIRVCHFPPGISKWNRIEHQKFCPITQDWRSRPFVCHKVIVKLIVNTATQPRPKI